MSLILRYISGSTYTLVAELVGQEYGQELAYAYHIPLSDVSIAAGNGLSLSKITIKGMVETKTAVDWQHINGISLDSGTSYQTVVFSSVDWQDDRWSSIYPFTLTLVAYVQRIGASVRIPLIDASPPYKWGAQSLTLAAHGGNANASPKITILPPLLHFPLSQSLTSYEGTGITFTRVAAKTHGGISYGINAPAYDNGLYLASDTSTDVGKLTFVTATVRSITAQLKQTRYPSAWVIGAGAGTANLLTANQSNAETDTTGVYGYNGTLTRNTSSPLAGTADFKLVSTGDTTIIETATTPVAVTAGQWYAAQALVKTSGCAAGRKSRIAIAWYTAADAYISVSVSADIDCPTTATLMSVVGLAPATATKAYIYIYILSAASGEIIYADDLMLEALPTSLTIWTATKNKLTIDVVNNLLKWTDDTTTVQATFPTADYMAETLTDVVVIDGASHAVTVAAHPAAGAWTTQTGTLAAIEWPELTLGPLEGSIANLTEYDYALIQAEWEALVYSLAPWQFNTLRIPMRYAGTTVKDGQTLVIAGTDHSGLLGGSDVAVGSANVTLTESGGISCRWYAELARTDTP